MKLNPHETKIMQKFAVRTPDKNATDIKDLGLKTLGLVKENERLVMPSSFGARDGQDQVNAHRNPSVYAWIKNSSQFRVVVCADQSINKRAERRLCATDRSGILVKPNSWMESP